MDELQKYIEGDYQEDTNEINEIVDLVAQILPTFSDFFNKDAGSWPYELRDHNEVRTYGTIDQYYSYPTNAMIAHMAAITLWGGNQSVLVPAIRSDDRLKFGMGHPTLSKERETDLIETIKRACEILAAALQEPPRPEDYKIRKEHLPAEFEKEDDRTNLVTLSTTFGCNDPFTLTWALETLHFADRKLCLNVDIARNRIRAAASLNVDRIYSNPDASPLQLLRSRSDEVYTHAFPLLRWVQLARLTESTAESTKMLEKLRSIVYRQISFSSIRGGEFDAAELVFALEGTLRLDPEFDRRLVVRAFRAIEQRQRNVPNWRPLRPFVATPQGFVLLPISVEIANSLIQICDLLDRESTGEGFFSKNLAIFRNYSQWLRPRTTKGAARVSNGKTFKVINFCGWHSEHILKPDAIHLWMTSQVVLFLMHYASMLRGHVASRCLRAGRFAVRPRLRTRDEQGRAAALTQAREKLCSDVEPLKSEPADSRYKVSQRLVDHYIDPRIDPLDSRKEDYKHFSMLLYGPAGTRKTTVAEELAKALGFDLITITPSDFVRGGESEVELRGKAIFTALEAQSEVVVLFDEIDRLLLDRDSKSYRDQGDIFQFMTPGMLTKLNSLRKSERVVFIIATNYAERIDPALKRGGRIDDHFLLLPPDVSRRTSIIHDLMKKTATTISEQDASQLAEDTPLWTYNEYRALIEMFSSMRLANPKVPSAGTALRRLAAAGSVVPSIRLKNYRKRLVSKDDGDKPFEEFLLLIHLKTESTMEMPHDEKRFVVEVWTECAQELTSVRSTTIVEKLRSFGSSLKLDPNGDAALEPDT